MKFKQLSLNFMVLALVGFNFLLIAKAETVQNVDPPHYTSSAYLPSGSHMPAGGTAHKCSDFDADPANSCAKKNADSPLPLPSSGTPEDILGAIAVKSGTEYSTLLTRTRGYLKHYSNTFCNGAKVKVCVGKVKYGHAGFAEFHEAAISTQTDKQIADGIQNRKSSNLTALEGAVTASLAAIDNIANTIYNNNFLVIPVTSSDPCKASVRRDFTYFPESLKFTKEQAIDCGRRAMRPLTKAAGTYSTANANTIPDKEGNKAWGVGHLGCVAQNSTLKPAVPTFTSSTRAFFEDSSAVPSTAAIPGTTKVGLDCLVEELVTEMNKPVLFNGVNKPKYTSRVEIFASSSTGDNTANYCKKDFINLSKRRAEVVRDVLKTTMVQGGTKAIIQTNTDISMPPAGTDGKGTTGECAYVKDVANSTSTVFKEKKRTDLGSNLGQYLDRFQFVRVNLYADVVAPATSTATLKKIIATRPKYDVVVGCGYEDLPLCVTGAAYLVDPDPNWP